MDGLDTLGAEETTTDKTLNVIKKVGPGLVAAVTEELDKGKKPVALVPVKTESKSWLTKPAIGPIPGWGALLLGGGVLGGIGYAVKRIFFK